MIFSPSPISQLGMQCLPTKAVMNRNRGGKTVRGLVFSSSAFSAFLGPRHLIEDTNNNVVSHRMYILSWSNRIQDQTPLLSKVDEKISPASLTCKEPPPIDPRSYTTISFNTSTYPIVLTPPQAPLPTPSKQSFSKTILSPQMPAPTERSTTNEKIYYQRRTNQGQIETG
jgi:hypothetical protein